MMDGPETALWPAAHEDREAACARYRAVRGMTGEIAAPLSAEDQQIQSMPDVSPTKWHQAHVTWFFETFLLLPHLDGYAPFHPDFGYLFNSYYEGVGPRHARPARGLLSRPPLAQVFAYRAHVDDAMERLIRETATERWAALVPLFLLGLNHEQQHQELMLTDIKHVFSVNPQKPRYHEPSPAPQRNSEAPEIRWLGHAGGVVELGHDGRDFGFDNEFPRHRTWIEDFEIASRPVTNREFLDFIEDGGYASARHWLSDGWTTVRERGWQAPIYWRQADGAWLEFTLSGERSLDPAAPVCHLSFYEADAFARWAGARLPGEAEWEVAAREATPEENAANLLAAGHLHPVAATDAGADGPVQLLGDVWEWTQSSYGPYPGFRPAAGAVGEYNGKFMVNQVTLRGGSCVTPPGHARVTYRNFFYPDQRWQFTGLRLARDA